MEKKFAEIINEGKKLGAPVEAINAELKAAGANFHLNPDGGVAGWTEQEMAEGFISPEKEPEDVKHMYDYFSYIQFQAAGAILLPFSLGDYSVYLAYADCHNFPKRSVVVMKLKTVQRRWCADAKQKTQTDSDAGGRIWRNRLTPKR